MRTHQRISMLARSLTAAMLLLGSACSDDGDSGPGRKLVVLHTNDFHAQFLGVGPNLDYSPDSTGDDDTIGGAARIASKIKEIRAETAAASVPLLALDAGDFTVGSQFAFIGPTHAPEMAMFRAMGYDVVTLGNHEFDGTPAWLAAYLGKAVELGVNVPIVASNLVFSSDSAADDGLETHMTSGVIEKRRIITTSNGLKVGVFGMIGDEADSSAPFAPPVTFADIKETAEAEIAALRTEGAELIVALSHSGLSETQSKNEDVNLARQVNGLHLIISGHTHTLTPEAIQEGETIIVQAGRYGEHLGRLDLTFKDGRLQLDGSETIPIDDTIAGDAEMTAMVQGFVDDIDAGVWSPQGLAHDTILAETAFDVEKIKGAECSLYNLVGDAYLGAAIAARPADPPQLAVDADVRVSLLEGQTGQISVMDAFRTMPLGYGLDSMPGYPLVTFFISGSELKDGMEVNASVVPSGAAGTNYFLAFSGMRFEHDPARPLFDRVTAIYLGNDVDGYSDTAIDVSDGATELYEIVATYYVASLIGNLTDLTSGLLVITPKDENGDPITNMAARLIDADPVGTPAVVEEIKAYRALFDFLSGFPDTDADQIPDVPQRYSEPTGSGRITAISP